jgi:hypothetical protein
MFNLFQKTAKRLQLNSHQSRSAIIQKILKPSAHKQKEQIKSHRHLLKLSENVPLKVHKRENLLGFDFEICTFS